MRAIVEDKFQVDCGHDHDHAFDDHDHDGDDDIYVYVYCDLINIVKCPFL